MRKAIIVLVCILMCAGAKDVRAQEEKSKVPVFNYVIDDPMDKFGNQKDSAIFIRYFLYPQFYTFWPITYNDTVLKYLCFDQDQNLVDMDTVHNILKVQHISFIKTYTDYLQTKIDTT